ncbi:MAG: NAD(P)/FAD-dependent oxidoreductase [Deltaproteobacteria bacterium]|nr:NAD(P)/FAD-dependent oxidoreductase [Deltaproteobacteria bacterium]
MKRERTEVLVVGGGPAGLAAAEAAAGAGRSVMLLDDNPRLGGQLWRADVRDAQSPHGREVDGRRRRLAAAGVVVRMATTVIDAEAPTRLWAHCADELLHLHADRVVLASGARELLLPFPGWTRPGVFGVGGLQALVKAGLDVDGRRVVVAGTGPLLLAVASALRRKGAKIVHVLEQTSRARLARFGLGLWRTPSKLTQGLSLMLRGGALPLRAGAWPCEAHGDPTLRRVTVTDARGSTSTIECDLLACGFGLVPQTRLARLLSCEVDDGVVVDALQRTSVPNVFAAGELCGIGGHEKALVEGQIAGLAAAGQLRSARALAGSRRRALAFARRLARDFALRDALRRLVTDDTIVCRCEDVPWSHVRDHTDARHTKLTTRCGMGPCQGRVCQPALAYLLGHGPDRPRPPLRPVPLGVLAELRTTIEGTAR